MLLSLTQIIKYLQRKWRQMWLALLQCSVTWKAWLCLLWWLCAKREDDSSVPEVWWWGQCSLPIMHFSCDDFESYNDVKIKENARSISALGHSVKWHRILSWENRELQYLFVNQGHNWEKQTTKKQTTKEELLKTNYPHLTFSWGASIMVQANFRKCKI